MRCCLGSPATTDDSQHTGCCGAWSSEEQHPADSFTRPGYQTPDTKSFKAQQLRGTGSSNSNSRGVNDSVNESPVYPKSKRSGFLNKRSSSRKYSVKSGTYGARTPTDVLTPRNDSQDNSDFDSGSSDSEDSEWDRFTTGHFDQEGESTNRSAYSEDDYQANTEGRKKETSLFGVTDKKRLTPLKETQSLKLAKLRGCTFVNQYVVIKYLGRGACGRVFLCMDMTDNRLYAVKIVKKVDLEAQRGGSKDAKGRRRRNPIEDLKREVAIMRTLRHKNIVSLQEVVDDPSGNKMLLVMDYMEGGPVMTREALEKGKAIPETLALQYFRDMCKALDYLHYNKVVHGDLKPENVLMSARGNVTLSDFGCSKVIISGNEYLERCNGTPAFLAPEMMKPHSRYRGRPTDVYALGACLYTFVYGRIPFNAPNVFKLFQVVQNEPLRFPEQPAVSDDLKDLLLRMLAKNPKERISLSRMMKHPWVTRRGSWPLRSMKEIVRHGEDPDEPESMPDLMSTVNVLDIPRQDHLLEVLQSGLHEHSYADGELLLRQGEPGIFMLYILQGKVDVTVRLAAPKDPTRFRKSGSNMRRDSGVEYDDDRSEVSSSRKATAAGDIIGDDLPPALLEGASKAHEFATLLGRGPREYLVAVRSEGQFVGEMAAFSAGGQRCASVRAKGPVRVKIIPGERLEEVTARVPEARQQVQEMVWMKQSENMVLEAMTRLSTVYDALEDLLRQDPRDTAAPPRYS